MIDLSITVLHFNRWNLTKDCLASIDAQKIPCSTYEKVLVDNGSHSVEYASLLYGMTPEEKKWRVVRYDDNHGHIVGQNRCFQSAKGEWVLFVANDVRLQPHCLTNLLHYRDILEEAHVPWGQLQPILYTPEGKVDAIGLYQRWPGYWQSYRHPMWLTFPALPSTCYLMRKSVWEAVGGFDEHLETSHEDAEMGLRLVKANYTQQHLAPMAAATHLVNATLKHQPSHSRAAFHRDRLYILKKHYRGLDYWTRYLAVQLLDHLPLPQLAHTSNCGDSRNTSGRANSHHSDETLLPHSPCS